MQFVELSPEEFEPFAEKHQHANFVQSVPRGLRRQLDGWKMHLVGIKDENGTILAAAELDARHLFVGYYDYDCLQGPLVDYDNLELRSEFLDGLKNYVKAHGGVRLIINPPIVQSYYLDGERISDYDGSHYVSEIEAGGFKQISNEKIDQHGQLFRWYFAKNLSGIKNSNELMDSFDQQTRWSLRKSQKIGVNARRIDETELDKFYDVMKQAETKWGFAGRPLEYYRSLMANFGDKVHFMLAELRLDDYLANLNQLIADCQSRMSELETQERDKKIDTAIRVAGEDIANYQKKLAEIDKLRESGDVIVLAAAIFIEYGGEMVYFLSGSYQQYSSFNGQYALQWYAMNYAIDHSIPRYNFYGTDGIHSGQPDQESIYKFKRGFGGSLEEQIGFFTYIANPRVDFIRNLKTTLLRR